MMTDAASNRSLPKPHTGEPDFINSFDGNGNLLTLSPGSRAMVWDRRNQLSEIVHVFRNEMADDDELYRYDSHGQRLRKVQNRRTKSATVTCEVRYLPGLQIHSTDNKEIRCVLTVDVGDCAAQALHWNEQSPEGITNDQIRYQLSDHLGSCTVELDEGAAVISQEGYYAFGGTSWWLARSDIEASFKMIRYSGKERDASGLYYYGYRYYAPSIMRWLNPDPANEIDGPNLYVFVRNNPVCRCDSSGLKSEIKLTASQYWFAKLVPLKLASSKPGSFFSSFFPDNISLQPLTLRGNGKYKQASDFKLKRIDKKEAITILGGFEKKYNALADLMKEDNLALKGKPWSENQINNMNLGVSMSVTSLGYINSIHGGSANSPRLFKLIDKSKNTHALALTSRHKQTLTVKLVISHPHSQLSELSIEQREHFYSRIENSNNPHFQYFDSFSTKKTGSTITNLAIIKEIKSSPIRIRSIETDAINPRSINIVNKFSRQKIQAA
jgi:RHS repeat-associated protein